MIANDGEEEPSKFKFYEKKYVRKQKAWVKNEIKKTDYEQ